MQLVNICFMLNELSLSSLVAEAIDFYAHAET